VLHKLKSRSGDVTSYAPTNTLIVTDHAANVRRMVAIVEQLDVGGSQAEIWLVRPKHADVKELAQVLTELFAPSSGGPAPPLRIVEGDRAPPAPATAASGRAALARFLPDPASGSLIIVASEAVYQRALAVARLLDREEDGARPQAWVYPLKHGDAEGMAAALGGLGAEGARRGGRGAPAGATGTASLFEGPVRVNAEKSRNALLIVASMRDYLQVRRVLQELDRPRRQVYVEAYVLEVGLDRDRNLGFAFHGAQLAGSSLLMGGLGSESLNSMLLSPTSLMGLAAGVRGPEVLGSGRMLGTTADGKSIPDIPAFGVVFQALQLSNQVNMLSSPHLLTMDNEEAEIVVGRKVPMRGAASPLPASAATAAQLPYLLPTPVERVDVGVKLKLTPTIGEGDAIRLKIKQEVSNVDKDDVAGLGPSTSQKQVSSMVVVRDQQTIVIGGLLSDEVLTSESKVPLLGDIPILGFFFKQQGKKVIKRNLLVVITPYIIRDQADLRRVFKRKLEEREEFLRRYGALRQRENLEKIDYGSKRGLLAEIDRVAREAVSEAALAKEAGRARGLQAERVELPATRPAPVTAE
jgi:general secretion pathway protein D